MPDFPKVQGHTTGSGGYQNSGGVQSTGGEQATQQPAPPASGGQQQAQAAPPPAPAFLPPIPQTSAKTNSVKGQPVKGASVGLKTTDYNSQAQKGNSEADEEIEQDEQKTPLEKSDTKKQTKSKPKPVVYKYQEDDYD